MAYTLRRSTRINAGKKPCYFGVDEIPRNKTKNVAKTVKKASNSSKKAAPQRQKKKVGVEQTTPVAYQCFCSKELEELCQTAIKVREELYDVRRMAVKEPIRSYLRTKLFNNAEKFAEIGRKMLRDLRELNAEILNAYEEEKRSLTAPAVIRAEDLLAEDDEKTFAHFVNHN